MSTFQPINYASPTANTQPRAKKSKATTETGEVLPIKLSEIIIVVRPSIADVRGRKLISFPMWRCQAQVDGRDAAPEAIKDWRDLSFEDFMRQLQREQAISQGEEVVWGEYDQVITSDITFAGAVQEQLQGAKENGSALNEVSFMITKSKFDEEA